MTFQLCAGARAGADGGRATAEARRAAIVQQERTRLLLAATQVRDFLPPGTLTREDRAALDALAGDRSS